MAADIPPLSALATVTGGGLAAQTVTKDTHTHTFRRGAKVGIVSNIEEV